MFFTSHDRAEHRLKQLAELRALACFRPHTRHGEGSAPYHYVLGPAGAAVLAAEQDVDVRELGYRQDKALDIAHSQRLAHTIGLNGFFTALVAYAHQQPPGSTVLAAWWSERRCHARWGRLVRPDGYGRWHQHGRQMDFFLEYDLGSEPLERLAAKLGGYQDLAIGSKLATPVLFWLPSAGREATARRALAGQQRWGRVRFVVATASPTLALHPAERAWLPLGQTAPRRRLVELGEVRS